MTTDTPTRPRAHRVYADAVPTLRSVLIDITMGRKAWNQANYATVLLDAAHDVCGTAHCLAGWIVNATIPDAKPWGPDFLGGYGDAMPIDPDHRIYVGATPETRSYATAYRFRTTPADPDAPDSWLGTQFYNVAAQEFLGVESGLDADSLWRADNTLADLWTTVEELTGGKIRLSTESDEIRAAVAAHAGANRVLPWTVG